ncbi:MAG TPA: Gfo/Idh/MocA family oxidoreductase [Thermoanaerobaculia bacterium]|jgi:predicted dehydrogenase
MARVGIVGTGWGARVQVPAFREAGLEVVALAGRDAEKTRGLASELQVQPFDDWRSLISSVDIDLVSIVTPPSEHLEMATAALAAGKHVLSEKPTALNAGEAERLVEAARRAPEQLALIDHELRFLPSWREARSRIGELGAIRYAEVRYSSPARGDRNRAWNWWSDAAHGGGVWGAVGSHFVDALRYFGMEIAAVQALLHTAIAERSGRPVTSDDVAAVHLRLTAGAVAMMTFSGVASGPDEPSVLTIHGEEGAMRFSGEEVLFARRGQPFSRMAGEAMADIPGNSFGGAFGSGTVWLGRALHAALDGGEREALAPAATFEDGLAQQRVLDAARASSAADGRWVLVR